VRYKVGTVNRANASACGDGHETKRVTRGRKTALGAAMFVLTVGVVGWRICHRLDDTTPPFAQDEALTDFRDAVYYPVVAFLDGENPYDREHVVARYPIHGTIGLYAPSTLLLHLPFGLLPYRVAELAFVMLSFALVVVLAYVASRIDGRSSRIDGRTPPDVGLVLGLAAVMLITRPGHWNAVVGQVSLEAALATIAALWFATRRPGLAGVGFAVASFKPTYGLPLVVLLAARRAWRALAIGLGGAALLSAVPLAVLFARIGMAGFVHTLHESYVNRIASPAMRADQSTFRVDVVALVARTLGHAPRLVPTLLLTGLVLALAVAALRRLPDDDPMARRTALAIASLAIVLCTYHQQYDLVILAPLVASVWPLRPARPIHAPAALAGVPFVNYLASGGMQRLAGTSDADVLWLSSLNIVALLGAFGLLVAGACRQPRTS
jgi:hypothetical protein